MTVEGIPELVEKVQATIVLDPFVLDIRICGQCYADVGDNILVRLRSSKLVTAWVSGKHSIDFMVDKLVEEVAKLYLARSGKYVT